MSSSKPHIEMLALDLASDWTQLSGQPPGLEAKLLSDDLDEASRTGSRTRLIRFAPGTATSRTLVHEFWEEVFLVAGDLSPKDAPRPSGTSGMTYSIRPPGTPHGPFKSHDGCVLLEVQYYLKD